MRFVAPGEHEAGERAWAVVRAAYAEREPVRRPRRHAGPLVAVAILAAVGAAALSPPGRSVVRSLRKAVGVKQAEPALFSLPAPGRLLVTSRDGLWLVHADGSKRLLGRYGDASFSPHGLFVAATQANQLVALDPKGEVRWALARPAPRFPVWTGTRADTRIAYLSGGRLRIVAGDGTGDYAVGPAALTPPVWRPGRRVVYSNGRRAVAYDARAHRRAAVPRLENQPRIVRRGGQSEVVSHGRVVFRGTGVFDDVIRSPDGRWLLVSWPTANQWVFVRLRPRKIVGAARITQQFGPDTRIAGWCCR
ncbi:MAG TPA: hypothetical protein VLD13_12515 [Gaiellaceae bacterium]|nr:hypothetical protein [Gaiellaceae bacterium]